jgi:FMN reductase
VTGLNGDAAPVRITPVRITSVIGNPRSESRTHGLARTLVAELARVVPGAQTDDVDLAVLGSRVLEPDDAAAQVAVTQVAESDILVISSPTYKASYSGLLKSFLDRFGHKGLTGKSAVPILLGGLPSHQLAVDVHFSPLLLELGAMVPAGGLFVLESDVGEYPAFAAQWAQAHAPALVAAILERTLS